jgi:hypothetical protein
MRSVGDTVVGYCHGEADCSASDVLWLVSGRGFGGVLFGVCQVCVTVNRHKYE